jgi:hypothetical protein
MTALLLPCGGCGSQTRLSPRARAGESSQDPRDSRSGHVAAEPLPRRQVVEARMSKEIEHRFGVLQRDVQAGAARRA